MQEQISIKNCELDLTAGYPKLSTYTQLDKTYFNESINRRDLSKSEINCYLIDSVRELLGIPSQPIETTYSGSIALDRAVSSLRRYSLRQDGRDVCGILTSPGFDILPQMLKDKRIELRYVRRQRHKQFRLDITDIEAELRKLEGVQQKLRPLLILTSPDNPTGDFLDTEQLDNVLDLCNTFDCFLLIDHCFIISGLQQQIVPAVWMRPNRCPWMAIWDTGKTFDLCGEKLGFVISSSHEVHDALLHDLNVLQFSVPARTKVVISEIIRQSIDSAYFSNFKSLINLNFDSLSRELSPLVRVLKPRAGTLALLNIESTGHTDEQLRLILASHGVGLVACETFFQIQPRPRNWMRVALAREPELFDEAANRIKSVFACLRSQSTHEHHSVRCP